MPAAMMYIEPNSPLRSETTGITTSSERKERTEKYKKSRAYYEGRQKKQLDKKPDEPDDNVIVNVTKMAIDRTLSFLFPIMPALELAPTEMNETTEETWLREAWDFNDGIGFLHDVATNGSLIGHCYVRILPPELDDKFPSLVNIDPTSIITYWKADNIRKVLWHELYWTTTQGDKITEFLQDIINLNDHWEIHQFTRQSGTQWVADTENFQVWEFPWGPIVHWPHLRNPNRFYGKEETDHLELNDKLNLIVSENARINRYHSSPKTVATGVAPDKITESGIDNLWVTENDKAEVFNLEMKSNQEFAQNLATFMFDSYLAESRVVILKGEAKDFQRVTNAAVRTLFMDMLSKNATLRHNYGRAIQQISQRMGLLGLGREDIMPDVIHADPLPTDDQETVNIAAIERSMGIVSRQTIAQKRGYSWGDEKSRMTEESKLDMFAAPGQPPKPGGNTGLVKEAQNA